MKKNRKTSFRAALAALAALALSVQPSFSAQDRSEQIDQIFAWTTPGAPGCAVVVSLDGEVVAERVYGAADLERDVAIGADTVFDIGSLSKQFVAAAVLILVEDQQLSLDDDIRKHIPELPDYGHTVTIDHLLTHTSGIRDWTGVPSVPGADDEVLAIIFRQRGLNFPPGEEWSYSNSGYELLREIVARKSGMSFADFSRERLFEPLGMRSTSYHTDLREIIPNRALAYERSREGWRMAMLLDNDRGAGGLFSTAHDLTVWNEALASGTLGPLVTAKLREPARLNNGRVLGYSRGLFLDTERGTEKVWHTGSADGYKGWLGRYPEHKLSIAILSNAGDTIDTDALAEGLAKLFLPESLAESPQGDGSGADISAVDVSGRTGLYFSDRTGDPLRLVMQGDWLRIAGGPGLVPVSPDRFERRGAQLWYRSQDAFELRFVSKDEFEMRSMEGEVIRYIRARDFAPTAADLETFAGRYGSEETDAVFEIQRSGDGLILSLEHSPGSGIEFRPVHPDTFQWRLMTLRFVRESDGSISAFDYSTPLIRNLRFGRLAD